MHVSINKQRTVSQLPRPFIPASPGESLKDFSESPRPSLLRHQQHVACELRWSGPPLDSGHTVELLYITGM